MKKKVIVGVFSVVLTIGLIALLAFTLFSVKNVKIDFRTSRENLTASEEEIIEAGEFDLGNSVFFLNKQKYINKIEEEYPYLNVVNIETVFPSTLVVHVAERQRVYAVQGEDGYYICDEEMKVLKMYDSFETYQASQEDAILLEGDFVLRNEQVGDFLEIKNPMLYQNLYENNFNLAYAKEVIKSINMTKEYDEALKQNISVLKLSLIGGQTVTIANFENALSEKVYLFVQAYSSLFDMIGKESLQKDGSKVELTEDNLKNCEIYINNYYTEQGSLNLSSKNCYLKIFVA